MYLNTMARYLGDTAESTAIATVRRRCSPRWRTYKAAHPNTAHAWRLFLAANPSCRKPPVPHTMTGLGTTAACNDANTGLLINCWQNAVKKGLGGLGTAVSQEQLTALSTAYQRLTKPRRLAGLGNWVFTGSGMKWQPRLGDSSLDTQGLIDDSSWLDNPPEIGAPQPAQTPLVVAPSYVPAPDISTVIASQQPSKIPSSLINFQPTLPTVTAQTLIAAAALPNAPANVKAAAAQVSSSSAGLSSFSSLFTGQMISGIPNYVFIGGGLLLVLMLSGGRRRR